MSKPPAMSPLTASNIAAIDKIRDNSAPPLFNFCLANAFQAAFMKKL